MGGCIPEPLGGTRRPLPEPQLQDPTTIGLEPEAADDIPTTAVPTQWRTLGAAPCEPGQYVAALDPSGFGICSSSHDVRPHALFRLTPLGIETVALLPTRPAHLLVDPVDPTRLSITVHDVTADRWGLLRFDTATGDFDTAPFPLLAWDDAPFAASYGHGMAASGLSVFVAASNLSLDGTTGTIAYRPGTVVQFDAAGDVANLYPTSGLNPTTVHSVMLGDVEYMVVVNAGTSSALETWEPATAGSLDLIDVAAGTIAKRLDLPSGVGLRGRIAAHGALLVVGAGTRDAFLLAIAWQDDTQFVPTSVELPEANPAMDHYVSAVTFSPAGDLLAAGDFNTGRLHFWQVTEGRVGPLEASVGLDTVLTDDRGLSDAIWTASGLTVVIGNVLWRGE